MHLFLHLLALLATIVAGLPLVSQNPDQWKLDRLTWVGRRHGVAPIIQPCHPGWIVQTPTGNLFYWESAGKVIHRLGRFASRLVKVEGRNLLFNGKIVPWEVLRMDESRTTLSRVWQSTTRHLLPYVHGSEIKDAWVSPGDRYCLVVENRLKALHATLIDMKSGFLVWTRPLVAGDLARTGQWTSQEKALDTPEVKGFFRYETSLESRNDYHSMELESIAHVGNDLFALVGTVWHNAGNYLFRRDAEGQPQRIKVGGTERFPFSGTLRIQEAQPVLDLQVTLPPTDAPLTIFGFRDGIFRIDGRMAWNPAGHPCVRLFTSDLEGPLLPIHGLGPARDVPGLVLRPTPEGPPSPEILATFPETKAVDDFWLIPGGKALALEGQRLSRHPIASLEQGDLAQPDRVLDGVMGVGPWISPRNAILNHGTSFSLLDTTTWEAWPLTAPGPEGASIARVLEPPDGQDTPLILTMGLGGWSVFHPTLKRVLVTGPERQWLGTFGRRWALVAETESRILVVDLAEGKVKGAVSLPDRVLQASDRQLLVDSAGKQFAFAWKTSKQPMRHPVLSLLTGRFMGLGSVETTTHMAAFSPLTLKPSLLVGSGFHDPTWGYSTHLWGDIWFTVQLPHDTVGPRGPEPTVARDWSEMHLASDGGVVLDIRRGRSKGRKVPGSDMFEDGFSYLFQIAWDPSARLAVLREHRGTLWIVTGNNAEGWEKPKELDGVLPTDPGTSTTDRHPMSLDPATGMIGLAIGPAG